LAAVVVVLDLIQQVMEDLVVVVDIIYLEDLELVLEHQLLFYLLWVSQLH
jgi:hypothetical protein